MRMSFPHAFSFFFLSLPVVLVILVYANRIRYQWSYKKGLEAGVLPKKAYERDFDCDLSQIPSFSDLPEYY
jgi:hypothetical protein